jgi:hypothetical protein
MTKAKPICSHISNMGRCMAFCYFLYQHINISFRFDSRHRTVWVLSLVQCSRNQLLVLPMNWIPRNSL